MREKLNLIRSASLYKTALHSGFNISQELRSWSENRQISHFPADFPSGQPRTVDPPRFLNSVFPDIKEKEG
jgi:hypothetical protein